jgi:hypothetical protein
MRTSAMLGIKVMIVRHVSDEPQPGIVECKLEDAHGRGKKPQSSAQTLGRSHLLSREEVVAGETIGRSI